MPENDDKKTELINVASQLITTRFKPSYHEIGAAILTRSGQVFSAVHIEATVGRIAVCAEAIAIGMAATAGDTEIEMIVAVNRDGQVVSPCGMCRELIADYAPDAKVIVPGEAGSMLITINDLLPNKYHR
ncbi:cytidine deaminase [Nostoc flagelliforme FACHB-838]|uniref:Cytidine deaminase n=1 Tax=Nostoc flagelliforme FACHB-838 TaxID=2692904 RepID=A0ABR8DWZ4_9NOSO|nr:cytidine deaminase [Nostoc flagelliforme]MBD2533987.1 cytidine deaminase [Nostoc flagelliforme FACHB-838]